MRSFYEKFSFCCDHAVFTPSAGNYCKNIFLDKTRIVTKVRAADETSSADAHREYFYHGDHLQSATLITDYEGAVYERINYTPYGELWLEKSDNNGENYLPYRFTGKELDSETGLYYYGARYLDPMYSRWLSCDPALGDYIPQAPINDEAKRHNQNLPGMGGVFNHINCDLYHYAGNNPVRYIDPNGRNVENNSNQYLIVKPESSKQPYVLLAPNETYIGEQDGIILSDGTTYKTYGGANFKVQNKKDGNISVKGGVGWTIVGNFIKTLCNVNPKRSRKEDYYGKHKYEGAKTDKKSEFLHSWLEGEKNLDSNNDGKTDKQDFEVFNLIDGGMPPAKDTENRWKENRL